MKTPSQGGASARGAGVGYALLGKPTPSAFATAVATRPLSLRHPPLQGGDFQERVFQAAVRHHVNENVPPWKRGDFRGFRKRLGVVRPGLRELSRQPRDPHRTRTCGSRPRHGRDRCRPVPCVAFRLRLETMKKPTARNLFKRIDQGVRQGVARALEEHRKAGGSVFIWQDGRIARVPVSRIKSRGKESHRGMTNGKSEW